MAGAIKDKFIVTMDHAQRRVSKDRLALFGQGSREGQGGNRVSGIDLTLSSSDVWQDFTTWTTMLRPQPTRESWFTSNSGANAKLPFSAFTASGSSSDWVELQNQQAAGPWIGRSNKATNGTLVTNASYAKNQPFSLSMYVFNSNDIFKVGEGGWDDGGSLSAGVGFIVYSNHTIHIYKDGSYVGEGTVTPGSSPGGTSASYMHLMLIPGRRRELLVLSISPGGGFSHVFEDIDEDDADPEITPAGKFWFKLNNGCGHVQIAPIPFATSGYAVFPVSSFAEAPESGRTAFNEAYWDPSFQGGETAACTMREAGSIGTVFSPNGVKTLARLRVDLTGGGDATPFLYGASGGYLAEFAETDDSESVEVDYRGESLRIDVPDSNSGARFSFEVQNPAASGIEQWDILSNRPCELAIGTCQVIDGRTKPPRFSIRPSAAATVASWEVADLWEGLRRYRFRERVILNGADLKSTIEVLVEIACGIDTAKIDIDPDPAINISPALAPVAGEWTFIIEEGDTADKIVARLFSTFLGGWFYGFVPGIGGCEFRARPPRTVADAADIVLYLDEQDAIAALISEGMTNAEARLLCKQRTVTSLELYSMPPEATEVRVTGYTRDRRIIQAYYRDSAAEDPTIAPSLRGENWQGERAGYGLIDGALNDQAIVDSAADDLGDALTRVRKFGALQSAVLFKSDGTMLYRGNTVEVYGIGKFYIRGLTASSKKEPTSAAATGRDAWNIRNASYIVEMQTGTTAPWGRATGARAVQDIAGRLFWQMEQISNPFKAIGLV